jgi:hypothetical protein
MREKKSDIPEYTEISAAWKLTEAKQDLVRLFFALTETYVAWQSTRGQTPLGHSPSKKKELISVLAGCFWTAKHLLDHHFKGDYHKKSAEQQGFKPLTIKEYTDLFSTMDPSSISDQKLNRLVTVFMDFNAREGYMSLSENNKVAVDWIQQIKDEQ